MSNWDECGYRLWEGVGEAVMVWSVWKKNRLCVLYVCVCIYMFMYMVRYVVLVWARQGECREMRRYCV